MIYTKIPTTVIEQIQQLKDRGLQIKDLESAKHFLSNISYYRLAGYWWPMQADKNIHLFKSNSKFEDVISLYNFDRELRLLLFDVIERIEISLRTKLIYHLSFEHGFWWFEKIDLFYNSRELIKTLSFIEEEVDRCKDVFMKDHLKRYKEDQRFPPSLKVLEITSFGSLSKLYGNLRPSVKSKDIIAKEFGTINHTYLPSWLQSIAQIRNICAHHGRLWNKNLVGRPNLLNNPPFPWIKQVPGVAEHHKLYIHLCCMKYLLNIVNPQNSFTLRLKKLLDEHANVDHNALGLVQNWHKESLWSV